MENFRITSRTVSRQRREGRCSIIAQALELGADFYEVDIREITMEKGKASRYRGIKGNRNQSNGL